MRKNKKILSLTLALVLCLGLLPTVASAATVTQVVPYQYDAVGDFSEGLAPVKRDRNWGYIDTTGKEVIPCTLRYDFVYGFHNGVAVVGRSGTHPFNDEAGAMFWYYIDTAGNQLFDSYSSFSALNYSYPMDYSWEAQNVAFHEGRAMVGNYGIGFIDTDGNMVTSSSYDIAYPFSEGFAAVRKDGKWGFIDRDGNEAIPLIYEEVTDFHDGVAAVRGKTARISNGKSVYDWGLIDTKGNVVVPFGEYNYQRTGRYDEEVYHEGLKAVKEKNGWGYIDLRGNQVIPAQYGQARQLSEGMLAVDLDGKWGFLKVEGLPTEATPAAPTPAPVTPDSAASPTARASTQAVLVDGKEVEFECYALQDQDGNMTNYIKLRDLAMLLNGSAAQFQVGWDGSVTITTKTAYTANGSELSTPYSGDRDYAKTNAVTKVNGKEADLAAFVLNDDDGGGYTYYQLRDLAQLLGFNVGWTNQQGMFLETDKPYDANN